MSDILTNIDGSIAVYNGKIVLLDQATQDEMEDYCCGPEPTSPGYELNQCSITCSNDDCDGSLGSKYTTPQLSPSLSQLSNGTVVKIAGSDACWVVNFYPYTTGTDEISVTATYTDCQSCCNDCYLCDDCEFPLNGEDLSLYYYEESYQCFYSDDSYSNLYCVLSFVREGTKVWTGTHVNAPCSPAFRGDETYEYQAGYASNGCGCHLLPLEAPSCSTSSIDENQAVVYFCSAGVWSDGPSGGNVDDGVYPNNTRKSVTGCDGGEVVGHYYRSYEDGYGQITICGANRYYRSIYKYHLKRFVFSGNNCGNPLP